MNLAQNTIISPFPVTNMMKGIAIVMGVIVTMCRVSFTFGEVYLVGDSSGWITGVDYSNWIGSKTFEINDILVFIYPSGSHTVDEVSSADYNSCTTGTYLSSDNSGSTNITLSTAGTHYFISGTPGDCSSGMKLSVSVGGAASAPVAGTPPDTPPISPSAAPPPPLDLTILLAGAALLKLAVASIV